MQINDVLSQQSVFLNFLCVCVSGVQAADCVPAVRQIIAAYVIQVHTSDRACCEAHVHICTIMLITVSPVCQDIRCIYMHMRADPSWSAPEDKR